MFGLKALWNKITGRDPRGSRLNDDGTMTTKHGNRIIPYKLELNGRGGVRANVAEFMFQPRVREIFTQVADVNYSMGQSVILDRETGDFYQINKGDTEDLVRKKIPLGQIDVELEERIFRIALQRHKMHQLFGDCSPDNPVVLDESSGRVYPQNDPTKTRGYVRLGETVENSSPSIKRPGFLENLID